MILNLLWITAYFDWPDSDLDFMYFLAVKWIVKKVESHLSHPEVIQWSNWSDSDTGHRSHDSRRSARRNPFRVTGHVAKVHPGPSAQRGFRTCSRGEDLNVQFLADTSTTWWRRMRVARAFTMTRIPQFQPCHRLRWKRHLKTKY